MTLAPNKVTSFTFRHQDQADKPGFASSAAFKQALDSQAAQLQTGLNGLIDALMNALAGTSGAEQMGSAPIPGVNGSTPYAQLADIKAQLNGVVLGQIPDGTITAAKLANDVMTIIERSPQLVNLERVQANLVAIAEINAQSIPQSGYGYDLFRGASLNLYSCAILDTFSTNVAAVIAAGATSVTLPTVAGLAAGREITLQDIVTESKRERLIIQSIVGNAVTFVTPTVNAYAAQAKVYRSLGKVDTVARKLLFGGASYQSTFTQTGSTVVSSAYDTSGNVGRKVTMLSNGWIVAGAMDTTTGGKANFYVSKDNGATWSVLCFITGMANSAGAFAMAAIGTKCSILYLLSAVASAYSVTFDVTTVSNADQSSNAKTVDSGQTTTSVAVSLAPAPDGSLHAAWASKNATYPNSNNIRYSKSVDSGATWAAPTQITTRNTTGRDDTNPCIVVKSNGNPVIVYTDSIPASNFFVNSTTFSGTAWGSEVTIYSPASTYAQSNPCAYIKQKGSNIGRIICRWHGVDNTDTTKQNERWSYSDDGGATWSAMVKITTGNTIDRQKGVLCEDASGNIYDVYMDGAGISYQSLPNGTTTWGGLTTLDAAGTNPAVIDQLDFTVPLTIYMSASTVKFRGTWVTTTTLPLTQEDIRYNITPPTGLMDELRSWMQYDDVAGFTVTSALSIVDTAANESFAAMTAATDDYGTYKETYFNGFVVAVQEKGAQRITMQRASVSDSVAVTKYLAAVIGG